MLYFLAESYFCPLDWTSPEPVVAAMDEKYDLKWKTFNEHLVEVFKDLGVRIGAMDDLAYAKIS